MYHTPAHIVKHFFQTRFPPWVLPQGHACSNRQAINSVTGVPHRGYSTRSRLAAPHFPVAVLNSNFAQLVLIKYRRENKGALLNIKSENRPVCSNERKYRYFRALVAYEEVKETKRQIGIIKGRPLLYMFISTPLFCRQYLANASVSVA